MKKTVFIILLLIEAIVLQAQSVNFLWAKQFGGTSRDVGTAVTVDAAGNVYITGAFTGTTDFDPGPGVYNLTSDNNYDIFILKLDPSGNLTWVKQIGGGRSYDGMGKAITLDAAGNIYVTGSFGGTTDFDPGPGVFNIAFDQPSSFVLKLNSSGNFAWAKKIGGGTDVLIGGTSIVTDAAGNVYTSGVFQNTRDFDPGPDVFNLDGAPDNADNIYITKLDASGNFIWAKAPQKISPGGGANEIHLALDATGNIYCTGGFWGTIYLESGGNLLSLSSKCNNEDVFVWKLKNDGDATWAKHMGGTGNGMGLTISVDLSGNIFTSGSFQNTIDFDPGPGIYNLTTSGLLHQYLSELDNNGNFIRARMDDNAWGYSGSTAYDAAGNIYTTGRFNFISDFDPGPGTYVFTPVGDYDCFVRKVGKCTGNVSRSIDVTDCKSYIMNGYTYTNPGTYSQTITSSGGCDSIITLNLTINRIRADQYVTSCGSYTRRCYTYYDCNNLKTKCLTYNSSGIYMDTVFAEDACDSIITLHLTVIQPASADITQTICSGQSYAGYSSSGTYIDTLSAANGCDSIRTIHLTVLPLPAPFLGADTTICTGESIPLYAGQFTTYAWQDGSAQNTFTATQPGQYAVTVSNSCGSASDEITITGGLCDVYFPSAFTPNNDRKNEVFRSAGAQSLKDYHLAVFNRYGQKVFETHDLKKGWTGAVNGKLQGTGVYAWYCSFKKPGSEKNILLKGTVLLIR